MLGQGKADSRFLALKLAFIKPQNTKDTVIQRETDQCRLSLWFDF